MISIANLKNEGNKMCIRDRSQHELKDKIEEQLKLGEKPVFSISFVSFGYKLSLIHI